MSLAMPVIQPAPCGSPESVAKMWAPSAAGTLDATRGPGDAPAQPQPADEPYRMSVNKAGRLQIENLSSADKQFGVALHLSPFAVLIGIGPLAFIAPVVLWLIRRDKSAYIDDQGREMVNVLLTMLIVAVVGGISGFPTLGLAWLLALAWLIVILINFVRGAIASGNGEYFRYPMTIRFL